MTILQLSPATPPLLWSLDYDNITKPKITLEGTKSREWADIAERDIREFKGTEATIEIETGKHSLTQLLVLRPSQPQQSLQPGLRRYQLLAAASRWNSQPMISILAQPPDLKLVEESGGAIGSVPQQSKRGVELPAQYWEKLAHFFDAKPGQSNDWTIPMPEVLCQAVRNAIKTENGAETKSQQKAEPSQGKG
jgi:hypothetical protein